MQFNYQMQVHGSWNAASARTAKLLDLAVRKAAFDIEANAKQPPIPVDTGAMRASIHVVTSKDNGHTKAVADAKRLRKGVKTYPVVKPAGPREAIVAVGVHYGIYVEMGTRKMTGRPYLGPAIRRVTPAFRRACAQAIAKGARP